MSKVFVSSVIKGFEKFRHTAKEAVEVADMTPVMVEDMHAQPYSSEQVCIKEVQGADLVVLILSEKYGYKTEAGISVVHTEYKEAIKLHKPVLVFIQDADKENEQQDFIKEVEDYGGGLFRKKFSAPDELKKQIADALDDWRKSQTSTDETTFLCKVNEALNTHHPRGYQRHESGGEPYGVVAFWGQPDQRLGLDKINCDEEFQHLCKLGIMSMKYGYDNGYNTGGHYKIIQSQKENNIYHTKVVYYDDGLTLLIFMPKMHMRSMAISFVSPSKFEAIANEALYLNKFNSSWVLLGLYDISFRYFAEPVGSEHSTSSNIPFRTDYNKPTEYFCHLFNPMTKGAYLNWINSKVSFLKEEFRLPEGAKCW